MSAEKYNVKRGQFAEVRRGRNTDGYILADPFLYWTAKRKGSGYVYVRLDGCRQRSVFSVVVCVCVHVTDW